MRHSTSSDEPGNQEGNVGWRRLGRLPSRAIPLGLFFGALTIAAVVMRVSVGVGLAAVWLGYLVGQVLFRLRLSTSERVVVAIFLPLAGMLVVRLCIEEARYEDEYDWYYISTSLTGLCWYLAVVTGAAVAHLQLAYVRQRQPASAADKESLPRAMIFSFAGLMISILLLLGYFGNWREMTWDGCQPPAQITVELPVWDEPVILLAAHHLYGHFSGSLESWQILTQQLVPVVEPPPDPNISAGRSATLSADSHIRYVTMNTEGFGLSGTQYIWGPITFPEPGAGHDAIAVLAKSRSGKLLAATDQAIAASEFHGGTQELRFSLRGGTKP